MVSYTLIKDLARLCNLAYLNQEKIKENFECRPYNCTDDNNVFYHCNKPTFISSENDCQLYICKYDNKLVTWFRGTESKQDILIDLNFFRTEFILPTLQSQNISNNILVHQGFYNQFNSVFSVLDNNINNYINDSNDNNDSKELIFVGHSLGGALATLGACYYSLKYPNIKTSCVTFGSPRVGNNDFAKIFNKNVAESYRFVNDNDPVPCLPSSLRFKHVNGCKWLYQDQLLNETVGWRFWRFFKNTFLSLFGYGYNALEDHSCENYIEDIDKL